MWGGGETQNSVGLARFASILVAPSVQTGAYARQPVLAVTFPDKRPLTFLVSSVLSDDIFPAI